jgi:hypothetical protein
MVREQPHGSQQTFPNLLSPTPLRVDITRPAVIRPWPFSFRTGANRMDAELSAQRGGTYSQGTPEI